MNYVFTHEVIDSIKRKIVQKKGYRDLNHSEHNELFERYEKTEYLSWARANNLPENLLGMGWLEYLED